MRATFGGRYGLWGRITVRVRVVEPAAQLDSHAVFPPELLPWRGNCRKPAREIVHLLFRDAVQIDSVPMSRHGVDDVLRVAVEPSSGVHAVSSGKD